MEFLYALYVLLFIVSVTIVVLLIRFLWMVPNELRDIANVARLIYYSDNESDDDDDDDI